MSLMGASDFDVARVIGIVDATVDVPAAQPVLGRPGVEGIASLPRQNGSNDDLHGGFLSAILMPGDGAHPCDCGRSGSPREPGKGRGRWAAAVNVRRDCGRLLDSYP